MFDWLWCKIFKHTPGDIVLIDEDTIEANCIHCGAFMANDDPGMARVSRETPEQRRKRKKSSADFEAEMDAIFRPEQQP